MTTHESDNITEPTRLNTYAMTSKSKRERFDNLNNPEMQAWLKNELNFWDDVCSTFNLHLQTSNPAKLSTFDDITKYQNTLRELQGKLALNPFTKNEKITTQSKSELLDEIFGFGLPHHDDPLSKEFKNACYSGDTASAIYTFKALSQLPEKHYFRGYDEGITKNLKIISDEIDRKSLEAINSLREKEATLQKDLAEAKDTITNIVSAATSAISLSEPVKFWDERKSIHRANAIKYGRYATGSAAAFIILLAATIIYEYQSGITHTAWGYSFTLPKTLSEIALILLISTAGIWSTRVFVKLMMANLTLEIESMERGTMTKTFVAMKAVESSIVQEAELLFYTTLFRPPTM